MALPLRAIRQALRRGRDHWVVLVTLSVASILLISVVGGTAWRRNHLAQFQQQCLNYTASPEQVMYEEDPTSIAKLLATDPDFVPCQWDDGGGRHRSNPLAVGRLPPCLRSFESLNGREIAGDGGLSYQATLFLHQRTSPSGNQRLVHVYLLASTDYIGASIIPSGGQGTHDWVPATRPANLFKGPHFFASLGYPVSHPYLTLARIYAGQPDSADPSHFTIRYRMWGQEDVLDGYLKDDDTVTLKPRKPPAAPKPPIRPKAINPSTRPIGPADYRRPAELRGDG